MDGDIERVLERRRPVILVVDDETVARQTYRDGLVSLGYDVLEARTGEEGIATALERKPDLVLLDLLMPGMNGIEVTRELRRHEETRRIPVIIITAHTGVAERVQALTAGATEFLSKPVYMSELRIRVRNVLKIREYEDFLENTNQILERMVAERTEELRRAYQELKETELETIRRLARAAEFRDDETGRHILRISYVVHLLGKDIGMDEDNCEMLLYTSPMHDVGKIGIPDRILLKPGKLDPEEWEIMKRHTLIGAEILRGPHAIDKMAEEIALTHHEKWDGSGYPNGLRGNDIPLPGRLVAIADVFDALVSRRIYKPALPEAEAIRIIREESGKHFDPHLVDSFLRNVEAIREIYKKFTDSNPAAKPSHLRIQAGEDIP